MTSERIARIILFFLLAAAGFAGVLAVGLPLRVAQAATVIHARMPENGGWSVEMIRAKVGEPVRLRMTSDDVLHSFAVGQSSAPPVDLLPGEWVEHTLVFDRPGRYTFYCTRWCGRNHWRMRGVIEVDGPDAAARPEKQAKPLYLQLGLDLDAPHPAASVPAGLPSSTRGAALARELDVPAYAFERETYLTTSPAALYERLRAEPALSPQPDSALWDLVAYAYARQTTPAGREMARRLYAVNCAACHGETGRGNGVMVEGLPRFDPAQAHPGSQGVLMPQREGHDGPPLTGEDEAQRAAPSFNADAGQMVLSAPPDFSDPHGILGASPALLEGKMLRGGMGTGMPYWGPIFTQEEMDALVAYLYGFAMEGEH